MLPILQHQLAGPDVAAQGVVSGAAMKQSAFKVGFLLGGKPGRLGSFFSLTQVVESALSIGGDVSADGVRVEVVLQSKVVDGFPFSILLNDAKFASNVFYGMPVDLFLPLVGIKSSLVKFWSERVHK